MSIRELNLAKDWLETIISYDPESGVFTWKIDKGNRAKAGSRAGATANNGYCRIKIDGHLYQAHRLAWIFINNTAPPKEIDHINGDKLDNRAVNLRSATRGGNCQNTRIRKDNLSGARGVSWNSRTGKWRARCSVEKREHLIGSFNTKDEAARAYEAFARDAFGEFYRGSE